MKKSLSKKNLFNTVLVQKPGRNLFDLSHSHTTSFNMGELIPISCIPCIPGDYMHVTHSGALRFQPMLSPMFHRVNQYTHTWFVPYRLLWDNFEKFIVAVDGGPDTCPYVYSGVGEGNMYTRLMNYLGIPDPNLSPEPTPITETINAWAFAAYQFIYNEWYRDQNLIPEVDYKLINGDNQLNTDLFELRKRAWGHDYFTSALPFAQKGAPVDLPLGTFRGDVSLKDTWTGTPQFQKQDDTAAAGDLSQAVPPSANTGIHVGADTTNRTAYNPSGSLEVEAEATATTINDLRTANMVQRLKELFARVGTRYREFVKGVFDQDVEDYRIDVPEYVTGSMSPVSISEVLNTTGTEDLPQGNMAGHGLSILSGKSKGYKVKEHGILMTIASVMPVTAYQQGISRHFKKFDPLDYFNPQMDGLGEQAVYNSEIYAYTNNQTDTWGYLPYGSEYRSSINLTTGDFQSSLDYWTMTRKFESFPALNADFITSNPTHRIFAVTDETEQKMLAQYVVGIIASRKMSKFGTPRLW